MNYPEEIESTFLELASFDERIKQVRAKVRSLELQITLDVTTAKDPETGKLLLSNDKQREGAIASTLAESEEYAELATDISNLEQDKIRLQARLERLRMEFKLHLLDCEQRNSIAAMKVADALWHARVGQNHHFPVDVEEVTLPF
jgi:chromosome segregation ATPase